MDAEKRQNAIRVPDLGTNGDIRVSTWLVEPGDVVAIGDRVVELLIDAVTFDVSVDVNGIVARIDRSNGSMVRMNEVLGWIETSGTASSVA